MAKKYSNVVDVTSREGITGTYRNWVLTLDCGHKQEAPKWRRGWRTRIKPAPLRVICRKCENKHSPDAEESRMDGEKPKCDICGKAWSEDHSGHVFQRIVQTKIMARYGESVLSPALPVIRTLDAKEGK